MKRVKKIGLAVLVALFSLSCTTTIESYILAVAAVDDDDNNPIIKMLDISEDGKIKEKLKPLKARSGPVGLLFSPNGKYLAAKDSRGAIEMWDVSNPREVTKSWILKKPERGIPFVSSVAFSPDSKSLASVGIVDGNINISKDENFRVLETFGVPGYHVMLVAFSFDSQYLISVAFSYVSKTVLISKWTVDDLKKVEEFKLPKSYELLQGVLSPDGKYLALRESGGKFDIWDTSNRTLKILQGKGEGFGARAFSPNTRYFVSIAQSRESEPATIDIFGISKDGEFKLLNTITGESLYRRARAIAFSHDDKLLAFGGGESTPISLWATAEDGNFTRLNTFLDTEQALAFRPEPESGKPFHLADPRLQEEKLELMRKLKRDPLKFQEFMRLEFMRSVDPKKQLPKKVKKKIKEIKTDIERLYLRSLYYKSKELKKWYEEIKQKIKDIKFPINLQPLKEKLENEYKEGLERIKQKKQKKGLEKN